MQPLLKLLGLKAHFIGPHGERIHAVNGASLEMRRGEVLGVLGESGSGKSTIAKALVRLLPESARVTGGTIEFDGQDILPLTEEKMQSVRGARISIIPQDPGQALNPVMKVGDQITEVLRAHCDRSSTDCQREAHALLERVHLADSGRRMYDVYPHQLSGGQRQRVVIAQSLSCRPLLVIADEPSASLDSAAEHEILELFRELKRDMQMSLLLITHDPRTLIGLADRVAVIYGGRTVEVGPLDGVFREPRHPYTEALLACAGESANGRLAPGMRLPTIAGLAPDSELISAGCSFAPRCARRLDVCERRRPSPVELEEAQNVECFLYGG